MYKLMKAIIVCVIGFVTVDARSFSLKAQEIHNKLAYFLLNNVPLAL